MRGPGGGRYHGRLVDSYDCHICEEEQETQQHGEGEGEASEEEETELQRGAVGGGNRVGSSRAPVLAAKTQRSMALSAAAVDGSGQFDRT